MQSLKKLLLSVLMVVSFSACCNTSTEVSDIQVTPAQKRSMMDRNDAVVVQELQRIVDGDPVLDAQKALMEGNKALWVVSNRIQRTFPGLGDISVDALQLYPVQSAPGMGDTLYGNEHILLRKQFLEYAAVYNQVIFNAK